MWESAGSPGFQGLERDGGVSRRAGEVGEGAGWVRGVTRGGINIGNIATSVAGILPDLLVCTNENE